MKKRALSLLLAFALVLGLLPAVSAATLDSGLVYEIVDDHVEITEYTGSASELVIPSEIEGLPVTVIGNSAFYHCYSLNHVTIPDSVATIEARAFYYCANLVSVDLPSGITEIARSTFYSCGKLSDIRIPDGVTTIGREAFWSCQRLTELTLPDSVTAIHDDAFAWCVSFHSFTIPASVTSIGDTIFHRCTGLTEILVDEANSAYSSADGVLFNKSGTELICFPINKPVTDYSIPSGVQTIADYAFFGCKNLESICLPASVSAYGHQGFSSCTALKQVAVDPENSAYCDVDGVLFSKDMTTLVYYPTGRTEGAYTIPDGVAAIDNWAFGSCLGLTSLYIPDGVTQIGEFALAECDNMVSIRIPVSVTAIGCNAFAFYEEYAWDRPYLEVYYPGTAEQWAEIEIDYNNYALTSGIFHYGSEPPVFTDVPAGAFYEAPVLWALENNITSGTSATTFSPGDDCMRAYVVTFLWRAAGCPEPKSAANPFVDVAPGSFYEKPVLWAVEKGITNGADTTHFNPAGVCNRAQIVTFLYRAFGSPAVDTTDLPFGDVPAGSWCAAPVAWAVKNEITNGLSATSFGPNTNCNRAQVVTFLYRAYT